MRNYCLFLSLMFTMGTVKAQPTTGSFKTSKISISLSAGYATEDLTWSIAGNSAGTDPNIYSELVFKDQAGPDLRLEGRYRFYSGFFIQAGLSGKLIYTGAVTDTDYEEDNRAAQSFRIVLDTRKGSTRSVSADLGYRIILNDKLDLSLSAGYIRHRQDLYLTDKNPVVQDELNSSYKTDWEGWHIKLRPEAVVSHGIKLSGCLIYQQLNYEASGNWNLIPEFQHPVSYSHHAKGFGIEVSLRLGYQLPKGILIFAEASGFSRQTGKGIDILYLSNGNTPQTRLNELKNRGAAINAGLAIRL